MSRPLDSYGGNRRSRARQYGMVRFLVFVAAGLGIFGLGLVFGFAIWPPSARPAPQYLVATSFENQPYLLVPILRGSLSE